MGYIWNNTPNNKILNLSHKGISNLDIDFDKCSDVTELHIYGNSLKTLPPEIGKLKELRTIRAFRNNLTELPKELFDLKNLEVLWLEENQLTSLPSEIGNLKNLISLTVGNNQLTDLPKTVADLKKLQELNIEKNRLNVLPDAVYELSELKYLLLDNNNIKFLSSKIEQLINLTNLSIDNNLIEEIPNQIVNLKKLGSLSIGSNKLRNLPREFCDLTSLWSLNLSNNQLSFLPDDFFNLLKLVWLNLKTNKIEKLPENGIENLHELSTLQLEGNSISALPKGIVQLKNLKNIHLNANQPEALPLENLTKSWDVFISHANEDKQTVAVPLAEILERAGLRVWLDTKEISIGDSIRGKIDEGLYNSQFGIIILSPTFLKKGWTNKELNALMSLEEYGQHKILPIWHNVNHSEIAKYSPIMLDKLAANTSAGIQDVALLIIDAIFYRAHYLTNNTSLSLTQRFAQLIGKHPAVFEIKNFLQQHTGIVEKGLGSYSDRYGHYKDISDTEILIENVMYSLNVVAYTIVSFLPTNLTIFLSDGALNIEVQNSISRIKKMIKTSPPVTLQEKYFNSIKVDWSSNTGHASNTIIIGRREALSLREKKLLLNFNSNSRKSTINLRTYDWLIDACKAMEKR